LNTQNYGVCTERNAALWFAANPRAIHSGLRSAEGKFIAPDIQGLGDIQGQETRIPEEAVAARSSSRGSTNPPCPWLTIETVDFVVDGWGDGFWVKKEFRNSVRPVGRADRHLQLTVAFFLLRWTAVRSDGQASLPQAFSRVQATHAIESSIGIESWFGTAHCAVSVLGFGYVSGNVESLPTQLRYEAGHHVQLPSC